MPTDDWAQELVDEYDFGIDDAREFATNFLREVNSGNRVVVDEADMHSQFLRYSRYNEIAGLLQDKIYANYINGTDSYLDEILEGKIREKSSFVPKPIDVYNLMKTIHLPNVRKKYGVDREDYHPHSIERESKIGEEDYENIIGVGCDFKGLKQIVEYEDDKVFIPQSYHCLIHAANKIAEMEKWNTKLKIPDGEIDLMTTKSFKKHILGTKKTKDGKESKSTPLCKWEEFPRLARWSNKKGCFVAMSNSHKSDSEFVILLIQINNHEYHAVISKNSKHAEELNRTRKIQMHQNEIKQIIDKNTVVVKDITNQQVRLRQPKGKRFVSTYYIYDIETSPAYVLDEKTGLKRWSLVPTALAYKRIEIQDTKEVIVSNSEVLVGRDCYEKFADILAEEKNLPCSKFNGDSQEKPTIFLIAHNGGGFDHIYSKTVEKLKFLSQIKGHIIKRLEAKIKGSENYIVFLDSLLYVQTSLENAAKYFNTKRKIKFNIKNMMEKDYLLDEKELPNDSEEIKIKRKWREYLKGDVECLAEIVKKLELYVRNYGCSIANHCGIPGIAWDVMNNYCIWMKDVTISTNTVTTNFIRQSIMGGRLLHWKKLIGWKEEDIQEIIDPNFDKNSKKEDVKQLDKNKFDKDDYICLDANSLYPSAMYIGQFPIGEFKVNNSPNLEFMDEQLSKGNMFLAEVTLDAGNIRYPLIPYKTEEGNLIYPANSKFEYPVGSGKIVDFRGVYTSVEIEQAKLMGYKITGIFRIMYWTRKERIFEGLIKKLYEERSRLKKEKNPMEYLCKILLNSLYGKNLEKISTMTIFSEFGSKKRRSEHFNHVIWENEEPMPNGQSEKNIELTRPKENKPTHIGAFILAYARAIMNSLILKLGPANIAYSDTDSVYVRKSALKGLETKEGLCNFKNDYGESSTIVRAMIIDIKRYLLELNYDEKKIKKAVENVKITEEIHKADPKDLVKLRDYEKACEDNYFPELRAKFTGITFKTEKAMQDWSNTGNLSELENMYAWYIQNPGKMSDLTIFQEKWARKHTEVRISEKLLAFSTNPDSRGNWINPKFDLKENKQNSSCIELIKDCKNSVIRLEYYPIGYDFSKVEKQYPNVDLSTYIDRLSKLHSEEFHIAGKSIKSRHPLKHKTSIGKTRREPIDNKKVETNFILKKEGKSARIFLMEKRRNGVEYYNVGDYGRKDKVNPPDGELYFVISIPENLIKQGITLTEAQTKKLFKGVNEMLRQEINQNKDEKEVNYCLYGDDKNMCNDCVGCEYINYHDNCLEENKKPIPYNLWKVKFGKKEINQNHP